MNKLTRALTVLALGCLMTGCSPSSPATPTPVATSESVTTATPTPQWTDEQQAAIDAVQNYLQVWASIGQDPQGSDWAAIRTVASDPSANNAVSTWMQWAQAGHHLVGAPQFIPDYVTPGSTDDQGDRYHVHGCYIITDSYLADDAGNRVGVRGADRKPALYLVLHMTTGDYLVLEDTSEEGTC
ncbi:MAG: hypothetical protein FWF43_01665 [Propionibacteriaceae bacterium]|nr:hypothetical protein [Propionibacteriaceae bacterium]